MGFYKKCQAISNESCINSIHFNIDCVTCVMLTKDFMKLEQDFIKIN